VVCTAKSLTVPAGGFVTLASTMRTESPAPMATFTGTLAVPLARTVAGAAKSRPWVLSLTSTLVTGLKFGGAGGLGQENGFADAHRVRGLEADGARRRRPRVQWRGTTVMALTELPKVTEPVVSALPLPGVTVMSLDWVAVL